MEAGCPSELEGVDILTRQIEEGLTGTDRLMKFATSIPRLSRLCASTLRPAWLAPPSTASTLNGQVELCQKLGALACVHVFGPLRTHQTLATTGKSSFATQLLLYAVHLPARDYAYLNEKAGSVVCHGGISVSFASTVNLVCPGKHPQRKILAVLSICVSQLQRLFILL